MSTIHIRLATILDAAELSLFGAKTFSETFGTDNSPEDMSAYLTTHFAPELQASEITAPQSFVLLAVSDTNARDDSIIGYAYVVMHGKTEPSITDPDPSYLARFYIDSAWHGRGIAQQLLDHVVYEASERGARTLWLGVWEHNPRAIAFYQKCGFNLTGSQTFQLGNDLQTDLVMERVLTISASD